MARDKQDGPVLHNVLLRFPNDGKPIEVEINRPDAIEEQQIASALIEQFASASPIAPPSVGKAKPTLSVLIEDYSNEKKKEGSWKPKTVEENGGIFDLALAIIGDINAECIDHEVARNLKQTLQKLPPNMNKDPLYRGKSVHQIASIACPRTLSTSSINKYLGRLSSLFDWAERHGYLQTNPFCKMQVKKTKRAFEERDPFSNEDLGRIFGSDIFLKKQYRHSYYYWLPLLGLYTGARIEELCKLYLDDIRNEGGVLVIDINEDHDGTVKTPAGKRLIPVHSHLIGLGLLDHVKRLRAAGENRLFPDLKKQRDGFSQSAQKWFNGRYRHTVGVSKKGKSFHSFRHTVANHLKQKGIEEKKIGAILGHADQSITTGRYGNPFEPSALVGIIESLSYPIAIPKHFWG